MSTFLKKAADFFSRVFAGFRSSMQNLETKTLVSIIVCLSIITGLTGISQEVNFASYRASALKNATMQAENFALINDLEQNIIDVTTLATPVEITVDGQTSIVNTFSQTVRGVLADANVAFSQDDIVTPSLDEIIDADTKIVVSRVIYRDIEKVEAIPFNKVTKGSSLVKGKSPKVSVAGKNGEKTITIREKYVDGVFVSSEVVSEVITTQPVTEVTLIRPTAENPISQLEPPADFELDENGIPKNYKKVITGKAVAYSTKKKTKLVPGCVAVNFNQFPRGTKLYITTTDGSYVYGYAKAADTGAFATRPGNTVLVDLFFSSYEETIAWGAKQVNVYVL